MSRHVIHVTVEFEDTHTPEAEQEALKEIRDAITAKIADDFGVDHWGEYRGPKVPEVWVA